MQTKHNKEFIHYLLWAGRYSTISRKAGPQYALWQLGKTNTIILNIPPFLLLPPALYPEHDIIWCYPFGRLGSAVPAASSPNLLYTPASSLVVWSRKNLDTLQALLSNN